MSTISRISFLLIHIAGATLAISTLIHAVESILLLDLLAGARGVWVRIFAVWALKLVAVGIIPITAIVIFLLAAREAGRIFLRRLQNDNKNRPASRTRSGLRIALKFLLVEVIGAAALLLIVIVFRSMTWSIPTWFLLACLGAAALLAVVVTGSILLRWLRGQTEKDVALRLRGLLFTVLACILVEAFVVSTAESFKGPFRVRFPIMAEITATLFYAAYASWGALLPKLRRLISTQTRLALDLLCTNLVIALVLAELGIRILAAVSPNPLLVTDNSSAQVRRQTHRQAPGDLRFGFPMNKDGHYDADFAPSASVSNTLVISIGDSFSYGVVPHAYHFTTVAERELGNVTIYNMGYPGLGPGDYLHLLQSDALPLKPDLITIQLFIGNDIIARAAATDSSRWYDADRYMLAVVTHRLLILKRAKVGNWSAAPESPEGPSRQLEVSYPWLADPMLEEPSFSSDVFLDLELRNALSVCVFNERVFQPFFETLSDIEEAAGGVPLAFILIPDEFQIEDKLWEKVEERSDQPLNRDLPQQKITEWISRRGYPVLDLLPILRSASPLEDGQLHLYHLHDTHFNARGNKITGIAMATFIETLLSGDALSTQPDAFVQAAARTVLKEPTPAPPTEIERVAEISIDQAIQITKEYGQVLSRLNPSNSQTWSDSLLPHSKQKIEHALLQVMSFHSDKKNRTFLRAGALRLAYFQPGAAEAGTDIDTRNPSGHLWRDLVESEMTALARRLQERGF